MAVPSSGSLNISALAAEKLENDYTDVDTSYRPYSLKDITLGGATTVYGEDYDVTNTNSANKPDSVAPHAMSEWYGYDHDASAAVSGDCIEVISTNFVSSNQYNTTGCSSSTAITANSGQVGPSGNPQPQYDSRFVRYRNITGSTKNYNIRLFSQSLVCATLEVWKGTQSSNFAYILNNYTKVHEKSNQGYTTFTGVIDDDDELLVILTANPEPLNCDTGGAANLSIANLYFYGTACSYNGTMYAVPLLGSGSSTGYQWTNQYSAWSNGYQQRYNSSSWSTAYIHQCAGSSWTIGNTVYQTNSSAGSEVAFNGTAWRCGAYPSTSYTNYGYPGGDNWQIIAFQNRQWLSGGNIDATYTDPFF
jgi:hypothetical protein